jgi:hypothetical protein
MNSLSAKRVFIALAKKYNFGSVQRCCTRYANCQTDYHIVFISKSGHSCISLGYANDNNVWSSVKHFKSHTWAGMLHELEGLTVTIGSERLKVNSIEELMINLELEGYLKNV